MNQNYSLNSQKDCPKNRRHFSAQIYKPSIIDRIFLSRKKILAAYKSSRNSVIFICGGKIRCVYLKFSYPGNIQYHKIEFYDLEKNIQLLKEAKKIIQNTRDKYF